ncbi:MAG TPA: SPOR domain-containing protein [Candidatus Sulfotelmatobacter sp.]|jgi:cell division septation protein DedD|nr:SPOR domain-containing protein [Candidatus Sulfotelmatobacter sp.]
MASSQDTEITLGTGKLLFLFFGLVGICATFFALGYSLGRKSEPSITTASAAGSPQIVPGTTKASSGSSAAPMTFYKSVEQKDASPELTPAVDAKTETAPTPDASAAAAKASSDSPDSTTTLPTSGYFVQVAAVSKQEDGEALVDALKKKDYPAFVATPVADKLFRVQVGPFSEIKDAEAMRARLIADGYSPILKK